MQTHTRNRWWEITRILIKHNFLGYIYRRQYGVKNWARWTAEQQQSFANKTRLVLEELGPAFIKIGQFLSTRPDFISRGFAAELALLQDRVEVMTKEEVVSQILQNYGQLPEDIFAYFNYEAAASASISQVHLAILKTGERVAVKIQRPECRTIITKDILVLQKLLPFIGKYFGLDKVCDTEEILNSFQRVVFKELDFCHEGQNIEYFRELLSKFPSVVIPKVYWRYTTKEILTMQWLEGSKITDYKQSVTPQTASVIAKNLILALLYPFFCDGVFHGDPHPGNVHILEDGRVAFLDFGITGRFNAQFRIQISELMLALAQGDISKVVSISQNMGEITRRIQQDHYYEDMASLVSLVKGMGSETVSFGNIMEGMINISLAHGVKLPSQFFLLGKSVAMGESLARELDPGFNILSLAEELGSLCICTRTDQIVGRQSMARRMLGWQEMAVEIPGDLSTILKQLARGEMRFIFHHRNLQWLYEMLEVISSRIALSMIVASITVASALTIHSKVGPTYYGMPIIGLVGFIASVLLGIWLAAFFLQRLR